MDKSEVMAFIKSCLDELGINYDTCDDCINITFENDDDLFPINVSIFPNENIISSFAEIDDMEIPSNRRSVVLEYINNYSCKGIEDDGNFNAYVFIYTDDETGGKTLFTPIAAPPCGKQWAVTNSLHSHSPRCGL